jgi:hypothetical protein
MSSMDQTLMRMRWAAACASGSGVLATVDKLEAVGRGSLRLPSAAAIVAAIGLFAGCSNLQIPVPADLTKVSEEMPITGRSRFAGLPG